MQRAETVNLDIKPRELRDPFGYILKAASGLRVLNVGASGNVEYYLPSHRDLWLHGMLEGVSSRLVGLDIDADSVDYARQYGVSIELGDCESIVLNESFDVIVMADVIEHVNSPVKAIENLASQLSPTGMLIITTPNPTHFGLVVKAWLGSGLSIYYDHVSGFLPEHFKVIADRLGLHLAEVFFFSWVDTRSFSNHIKSIVGRAIGKLFTRSHSTFLVVLQRDLARDRLVIS